MNKSEKWDSFYIALTSYFIGVGSMFLFKYEGINVSLLYFANALVLLEQTCRNYAKVTASSEKQFRFGFQRFGG